MKIVILNQYCLPCFAPTGRVAYLLGEEFSRRGHDVTIFASKDSYNQNDKTARILHPTELHINKLFSFCLGNWKTQLKIVDQIVYFFLAFFTLLFSFRKPDLIITMTTPPFLGLIGFVMKKIFRIKHIEWVMDLYPDVLDAGQVAEKKTLVYKFLSFIQTRILSHCNLVFVIGEDMYEKIKTYFPDNIYDKLHMVPLCFSSKMLNINIEDIEKYRTAKGWNKEDLVIMYSGNMGRGHSFYEFLAAIKKLKKEKNIRWVFAGGGKRKDEIIQFKNEHPDINIEIMPYAPADVINVHLASADIHLISLREDWTGSIVPSKLLDVFAIGKPVIYCGGLNTSISNWISKSNGGWCIGEGDVTGIVEAVKKAESYETRQNKGNNAKDFALKYFNPSANFNIICNLVEGKAKYHGLHDYASIHK